jgi:hypothetical protein
MFINRTSSKFLAESIKHKNTGFVNFMYRILPVLPGDTKKIDRLLASLKNIDTFEKLWLQAKLHQLLHP